jgi:hypothetical protein
VEGGAHRAICRMMSSVITPGPLGIAETRPSAAAPWRTASAASSIDLMQHTLNSVMVWRVPPAAASNKRRAHREESEWQCLRLLYLLAR